MTPRRDSYPDDRTPIQPVAALEHPQHTTRRPSGFRQATRGSKETIVLPDDILVEDVVDEPTPSIPSAWGERLVAATVPMEETPKRGSVPKLAVAPEPPPPLPARILTPSAPHPSSTPAPPPISGPVSVAPSASSLPSYPSPPSAFGVAIPPPPPTPSVPFPTPRPAPPNDRVRAWFVGMMAFSITLVVLGAIFVVAALVRRHM